MDWIATVDFECHLDFTAEIILIKWYPNPQLQHVLQLTLHLEVFVATKILKKVFQHLGYINFYFKWVF